MNRRPQKGIRVNKLSSAHRSQPRRDADAVLAHRDGIRGRRRLSLRAVGLLTLIVTGLLALSAAPASAALLHPYESQITEAGGSPIGEPSGLAVDSAGSLYIADSSNQALDKFNSSGAPATAWGTNGQITEAAGNPFEVLADVAVDGSDDLWAFEVIRAIAVKFEPSGAFLLQSDAEGHTSGLVRSMTFSTAAEHLYLADSNEDGLHVLEPDGSLVETLSGPWGSGCCFIRAAADNSAGATGGDLYVSGEGNAVYRIHTTGPEAGEPAPFAATTPYIEGAKLTGTPQGPFGEITSGVAGGVAVDSAGDLYVVDPTNHRVDEFGPSGEYLGKITGTPTGPGGALVAFGENISAVGVSAANGNLYVADVSNHLVDVFGPAVLVPDATAEPASPVTTTSATLHGEVNPLGLEVEECTFEYGETEAYGHTASCEGPGAAEIGDGGSPVSVHADVTGLRPGATYHFRLTAANENGVNKETDDQVFFTGAAIDATSASSVSATAATLEAELDPNGLPTTYHFEYDTAPYTAGEAAHGTSTPTAGAGSGTAVLARSVQIQGLAPLTTYHYRLVAENELGTTDSPDRSFTTQGAAASLLPDGRVWELVSPPDKHGSPLESITDEGGVIQAAADGSSLAYIALGPTDSEPAGNRSSVLSQLLAHRGPTGWATEDIATPHQAPVGVVAGHRSEYHLFSEEDLSLGLVEPFGATPLSPQTSERTPYLRLSDGGYLPLVTGGNVSEGAKFGGQEINSELFRDGITVATATPDLGRILLNSKQPLTPDFSPGLENTKNNVYEWGAGALQLVSWIPSGGAAVCGGNGPACLPAAEAGFETVVGYLESNVRNAVSVSGSRVVFSTSANGNGNLYLRDLDGRETLQLDAPEAGCTTCSQSTQPKFQDANSDGSKVFFTDTGRLTEDSTAGGAAFPGASTPDLYIYNLDAPEGERLTDLTVDNDSKDVLGADVEGAVIGASSDGSSVYFVANGALTEGEGAVHGNCKVIDSGSVGVGECNLYRYDTETGSMRLVTVLSGQEFPDWAGLAPEDLGSLTSRVSPNGRFLAFMSQRRLTGYDNRDAVSGEPDQEVYLYDAAADGGEGKIVCASCNPTGARPHGVFDGGQFPGLLVDRPDLWQGQYLAASIPGWTRVDIQHALYQSRYLSNSGRLFFNAADALVPQDSNGLEDIYEYEPPQGEGQPAGNSCTAASSTYSPRSEGCVSLISSGTSPEESAFLDASENGNDVFFLTASKLASTDVDNALDVYDASVDGHAAEPSTAIECGGDACQQPAVPPDHPTPGTALLNGPGNLTQCSKGKVEQKGKCVKKQQKSKKKKANHKKSSKKKGDHKSKKQKRRNSKGGGHR
jgi:hypothetical protein